MKKMAAVIKPDATLIDDGVLHFQSHFIARVRKEQFKNRILDKLYLNIYFDNCAHIKNKEDDKNSLVVYMRIIFSENINEATSRVNLMKRRQVRINKLFRKEGKAMLLFIQNTFNFSYTCFDNFFCYSCQIYP